MKSSLFVTFGSVFLLAWLTLSYVTDLKPEPRLGRGSMPLSAQNQRDTQEMPDKSGPVLANQGE